MTTPRSLWTLPLLDFREAIVQRASPGCGAAAAASADLGLALVMKGLRISDAKHPDAECKRLLDEAEQLLETLADHADGDMQAFEGYLEALQMPKDSEAQRERRHQALDAATQEVNRIPLVTAEACLAGLALALQARPLTEAYLQSDVIAGGLLLHSGLSAVLLNVDANLSGLDDGRLREKAAHERKTLQHEADESLRRLRAPT
ncbi:cyclodeaminase/cyclohydrolase family protein [Halomonas sp. McH1-25]|uniref:cyclodeaminase/cyclohydrolase family protein n=1 Tax=unclassified Halomonas TaxID=2609666 RepID=UPI001EF545F3|nr:MULTISPECIES: cyclodeaminase/cyclohydrolase family protein [unclassified Halomonas]MCG7599349.1 cyclodeaminase/cyclohydrolase family protein [Halomonas sp. McH1-25]MCP1343825.1 cyclodeaminase/cyclohydrolase family protein [Halomonas sp. FL8]MCP1361130.1 cyclodeaminase/cyclohydrolase family protein [Halomonas sp. BBD45]MCP1363837.1 cyclodeaminase/cyclohydrolase family protein [Halomonas sp. BBD48]